MYMCTAHAAAVVLPRLPHVVAAVDDEQHRLVLDLCNKSYDIVCADPGDEGLDQG